MNHGLHHLENYLIPDIVPIIDHYLTAYPEFSQFIYDPRFTIEELLHYFAQNFDFSIPRHQFQVDYIIGLIHDFRLKKGIVL